MVKINQIDNNVSINKSNFDKDFEIIKLNKRKPDLSLNVYDILGDDRKYVKAIFYERKDNVNIYILFKKGKILFEKIVKKFSDYKDIKVMRDNGFSLSVYLNLLLLNESDKISSNKKYVINNNFYHIVSMQKKIVVTLQLRFAEFDNNIFLENRVVTFSRYSELSEIDKKKQKVFYKINNKTLVRIYDISDEKEENLFVQKNIYKGKKNTITALLFDLNVYDSKIGIMGRLYKVFSSNYKYINNFSFKDIDMKSYKNKKLFDSYKYDTGERSLVNYVNKNGLTIVGDESIKGILPSNVSDLSYEVKDNPGNCLNLVVLNSNESGEIESDDIRYLNDKKSNLVVQHIGLDNLKQKEAVVKSLQELIIKNDIKNRYISYFDWDLYKGLDKTYTFFLKTSDENDDLLYHSMTIDTHGNILNIKINGEESFDKVFNSLKESDLGAIRDSNNNVILLRNTDSCFVLPDFDSFLSDIDKFIEGVKHPFAGDIWDSILNEIAEERLDLKDEIDDLFIENPSIYEKSDELLAFNEFNLKPNKSNKKVLSKALKGEINKYLKDRYQLAIVGAFKGEKFLDEKFTGVLGIHYNDNCFVVGATSHYMGQKLTNNINLREIEVLEGENFFEELLDMFYVPFVKNTFLTILPFPFKYLREAIDNPGLCV